MKEIILLGSVAVGKTTTARIISKKINKPLISLDDLRFDYYKEIGYDHVYNHANYEVAKHTVFVKNKTPEEVCDEVLSLCNFTEQNSIKVL